ncbi:MAG TPA: ATP-binding cassette domain-containing protein [Polyangiaceae bacterium]|nr:ATP-binding cassette domain-containing protein [Polyangiaceae bacterium]
MTPEANPTIEFDGVHKRYEISVVEDVSFTVGGGETFVLLGRSGSGKSTTLKMMNRLVEPTSGVIRVFGRDVREGRPEALRRQMGFVIQHFGLFPHYSVAENVAIVPRLLELSDAEIDRRVSSLLSRVGLPPERYARRRPEELSGGERQRVGLARALAADPPIVLLDEPFGALDPITRRDMQREFLRLSLELKKTMVLVTHDIAEAILLGHRIAVLETGRLEQIGTAKELLFRPATPFVRAFFDPGRFDLELLAVTVGDVVSHLPAPHASAPPSDADVPTTASLRDALEHPILLEGGACRVTGAPSAGAITAVRLLEGFQRFRAEWSRPS